MRILICAMTVLAVSTAQANTIYVDVNCPGPGNGTVVDPYCSIQTAIDNAVDTDEIVVAPGTYFEAINFLGKAITLRSSDGAEETIIDGTGNFHVVQCASGEGSETVLEGFTITGGSAFGTPGSDRSGGGMLNEGSSPTVTNCTFTGNSAWFSGGGMYNRDGSPNVTGCSFSGNSASDGGGMANILGSSPMVSDCTFMGNTASGPSGGGMTNGVESCPTVSDCAFIGNTSDNNGGGITIGGDSTVFNCTFSGNSSWIGAGMYAGFGNSMVTNCTFSGNSADFGGGGVASAEASLTVTNCTFSGNSADFGGGMYNTLSNQTVINCTFTFNSALGGNAIGFGFPGGDLSMANCILWNGGDEISNNNRSTIAVAHSTVWGGFPGTGNIDANPLFVDLDNGDYRLQAGSPCIDAGDNTAVPVDIATDLDGNPRFVDDPDTLDCQQVPGQCGDPPVVDMGAYELQIRAVCPWDCGGDNDGSVGINDFLELLAQWTLVGSSCDFDGGGVGINDFLELLANWGPCP